MIDNREETISLIQKMKDCLPIPAQATKRMTHFMREQGFKIKPNQKLQIEDIMYLGDEGGIGCAVGMLKKDEAVIASLTHIRVKLSHPLGKEIQQYQKKRIAALIKQDFKL